MPNYLKKEKQNKRKEQTELRTEERGGEERTTVFLWQNLDEEKLSEAATNLIDLFVVPRAVAVAVAAAVAAAC